jgi:uncharacterized protein GlcG (DUF336 family)
MNVLTADRAQAILAGTLVFARANDLQPLGVAVLDWRGSVKAYIAEDGTSSARFTIARGKADGALAMGLGSRSLEFVPVPGGVLIRDPATRDILGAVGISGDSSDNDERAAVAGITGSAFLADPGAD